MSVGILLSREKKFTPQFEACETLFLAIDIDKTKKNMAAKLKIDICHSDIKARVDALQHNYS